MALVVVYTLQDLLGSNHKSFHHKSKGQIQFYPFLLLKYPHRAGNPLGLYSQGTSALQVVWLQHHLGQVLIQNPPRGLLIKNWVMEKGSDWKIQDAVYLFKEKQHRSTLQLPHPMTLGCWPPHWLLTVKVIQIWIKMGRKMEAAATPWTCIDGTVL